MSDTLLRVETLSFSDFWFADGNVVLVSGKSGFKVHRGQLERHSEVFRDLFSIPQPPVQALVEGCPWVELYDHPADIACLLTALYDGLYFQKPNARNFSVIAAVLRLSTKYLIEHLRERCLSHLNSDWPSTLEEWDMREKQAVDVNGQYSPRDACPHPIVVIQLAKELDLYHLLPSAYYDLSRYGPRRIVSGCPDSSLSLKVKSLKDSQASSPTEAKTAYLTRSELHMVLLGREAGQRFLSSFIEAELTSRPISADCTNKHHDDGRLCRESSYYVMLNVLRAIGGITHGRDADPLFTLMQTVEMLSRTDFTDGVRRCGLKICGACKADLTECAGRARKHVWALIPEWFGLAEASLPNVPKDLEIHGTST
ncbi:hypothetical protein BDY19DRAFT_996503 [Irpex rosettiformis]|uniref:Uncharacterized protein n=1 Tax=Irpex rosettiformis TaxID=378272 RepID=A0ACB8TUU6_9APHY|nr:hypothetical protein BDY19DRAFT_996503 [Irpex rosettiformis]